MWPMIAEPGLRCAQCRHDIAPGRLCLSELPEETPPGLQRGDFRHYCLGCPQCWAPGRHACYVRHLDGGANAGPTPRSLPCARCARRIAAGERAAVDAYYDWPAAVESGADAGNAARLLSSAGPAVAAAPADALLRGLPSGSFDGYSQTLRSKFAYAGLGGERGVRSAAEAQAFYQDSIPYPIRNLGEDAVSRFLAGKEASHLQSVRNAPHLAAENSNFIWENDSLNRARGAANMTSGEQLRAQADNAFDAAGIMFRDCLETSGMTALYAALLEAPVAAIENWLHYRRGRKTGEEAVKDAAIAIAKRAVSGATIGFTITAAVALAGAAPLLTTIAPALLPVGMALYAYNALKRITDAYAHGLPLHRVGTYFCAPRCHTRFAWETGQSALLRWENNRVTAA